MKFAHHLLAIAALGCACPPCGYGYPDKPIRLLLPYPPGAGSDVIARLLAPARTSTQVIAQLNSATKRVLEFPEVRTRLALDAFEPVGSTPEYLAGYIRRELEKWAEVVKQSGAKID